MLFELLQVALGNLACLSSAPSEKEWEELYDESMRQAVTGILLHGIERLPAEQRPSQAFLLQWIGVGQMIEQRNHLMDDHCVELLHRFKDYGIHGTILKGQGIALLYDKELRPLRHNGDIDIYVDCGLRRAIEYAKAQGQIEIEWDYKHLHLAVWDNIEVEMHYRVEVLLNLRKNRRLQRWFETHQGELFGCAENADCIGSMVTPTVEFNVFYILLHIYRHFLYEGVGLRQIVDYYYVLKAYSNSADANRADYALEAVREFGMTRFARGLMWVMGEVLGMPKEWMLWEPDEKEGKFILEEVMAGGNFGHHDRRLNHGGGKWNAVRDVCKHGWHLFWHYPGEAVWAPWWFVWHRGWKVREGCKMRRR